MMSALYPPALTSKRVGVDTAPGGVHTGDLAVVGEDASGFGLLVDVHAVFGAPFGQAPNHGVMTDDATGGMVHGAVDRKGNILGNIQRRHQLLGFLWRR